MRTWSKDPRVQAEPGLFITEPGHRVPPGPQDVRKRGSRASGPGPLPFDSRVFPLENCCFPGAQRQRKKQTQERRKRNGAGERPSAHSLTHTHTHTLICSSSNICSVLGTLLRAAAGFPTLVLRHWGSSGSLLGVGVSSAPEDGATLASTHWMRKRPPGSGRAEGPPSAPKGPAWLNAACWRLGGEQDVTAPIPGPAAPGPH